MLIWHAFSPYPCPPPPSPTWVNDTWWRGGNSSRESKSWESITSLPLLQRSPSPSSFFSLFFHHPWQYITLAKKFIWVFPCNVTEKPEQTFLAKLICNSWPKCQELYKNDVDRTPTLEPKWQMKSSSSLSCFFPLPPPHPHSYFPHTQVLQFVSHILAAKSSFLLIPLVGESLFKYLILRSGWPMSLIISNCWLNTNDISASS